MAKKHGPSIIGGRAASVGEIAGIYSKGVALATDVVTKRKVKRRK